jgi:hypothetical protein
LTWMEQRGQQPVPECNAFHIVENHEQNCNSWLAIDCITPLPKN